MSMTADAPTYRQIVLRSVYWQASGQVVAQAFTWVISLLIIRLLSPGDYGLMATAGVFVGLLSMVAELGLGASVIQAKTIDREQLAGITGFVYAVSGAATVLTLLGAPLIAAAFDEPRVTPLLRALSICFVFSALYAIPQSLLVRELRFRAKASVEVAAAVAAASVSLAMALSGAGVWALAGSMITLQGTKAILFNVAAGRPVRPAWSFRRARPHITYGSTVTLSRIANHFNSTIDTIIGSRALGVDLLGFYQVALSIASIPLDKALPAVTQVSFAAFSRIQSDLDRVVRNLLTSVRLVGLVAFPAFFGLAVVAPDMIPIIVGEHWTGIIRPLQLLAFTLPLKAIAVLVPPAVYAVGRPGMNLSNMLITLLIMGVAFLIGVTHGVIGLAAAWIGAYPVAFLITQARALRVIGLPLRQFLASFAFPVLAAALMAGMTHYARVHLMGGVPAPLRLLACVVLGAGLYALLLLPYAGRAREDIALLKNV